MKHVSSDKYSVAWFKLAECVARGEQERAFGVYRLLSHSFEDKAFAHQLAGDLYLAFDNPELAIDKYEQAAQLYKKDGRLSEATAVYDHLATINSPGVRQKKNEDIAQAR